MGFFLEGGLKQPRLALKCYVAKDDLKNDPSASRVLGSQASLAMHSHFVFIYLTLAIQVDFRQVSSEEEWR